MNAELTKRNAELAKLLQERDTHVDSLVKENSSLLGLVTEQKVLIRQHELGAQNFQNCLETHSNSGGAGLRTSKSVSQSRFTTKRNSLAKLDSKITNHPQDVPRLIDAPSSSLTDLRSKQFT